MKIRLTDFTDWGCASTSDPEEKARTSSACANGNDDGDGLVDWPRCRLLAIPRRMTHS